MVGSVLLLLLLEAGNELQAREAPLLEQEGSFPGLRLRIKNRATQNRPLPDLAGTRGLKPKDTGTKWRIRFVPSKMRRQTPNAAGPKPVGAN